MTFEVTKTWKELPFSLATLKIPTIPGILISSGNTPGDGILFQGIEKIYSEVKLWAKLPAYASDTTINIEIENFM